MQSVLEGVRMLIADDEAVIRELFHDALGRLGVQVFSAAGGAEARKTLETHTMDLVVTDLKMPNLTGVLDDRAGMELLRYILGNHPTVPTIVLTAFGTIENAVEAMRLGAFDYICKPITDFAQLEASVSRAVQHRRLLVENQQLRTELTNRYSFDRLVGPSRQMQRIFELLATVAPTNATVLVMGESGTGKELVARAIHHNSPRARAPFIKVNCAALPEGLMESELFGHERGAFTGAVATTKGKFEAANGGTLLLDEIGELPLGLQAKLLRALQEREIQRVGSTENIKVDVRLIATTNVDLERAVSERRFRPDLFYRLNVIPIRLPSLSERREDIPILAYHFLRKFCRIHGRRVERISDEALRYLVQAPWPGNVRELENAVERAVVLCSGIQVELSHFFIDGTAPTLPPETALPTTPVGYSFPAGETLTLAELEKRHILATLRAHNGQRAKTAEVLGISIRTLRNKLNEYRQAGEVV